MAVQTRAFVCLSPEGVELYRASKPKMLRAWWQRAKTQLPPGEYSFKRVLTQVFSSTPADTPGFRTGVNNWKDQKIRIRANNRKTENPKT
ncbi:putative structural protein [Eel River basin pequenovirus]|nr:putative structural protein [Eel River basin pequenovirus]